MRAALHTCRFRIRTILVSQRVHKIVVKTFCGSVAATRSIRRRHLRGTPADGIAHRRESCHAQSTLFSLAARPLDSNGSRLAAQCFTPPHDFVKFRTVYNGLAFFHTESSRESRLREALDA